MDWPHLRPKASVFTVAGELRALDESLLSLLNQKFESWEWIVVLPKGLRWTSSRQDPRVRLIVENSISGEGHLKRLACSLALGEILIQLDAGDQLLPDALEQIVAAFDLDANVGLAYSDGAMTAGSGLTEDSVASTSDGWIIESITVEDQPVTAVRSFEPTPHNVSHPAYAPRFGRAFRRTDYELSGGYDAGRSKLTDEDLIARMYQHSNFLHLRACLHLAGSPIVGLSLGLEGVQQEGSLALYDGAIERNAQAWSRREGLFAIDLGPSALKAPGYLGIGAEAGPDVDLRGDIQTGLSIPDSSTGVIRAVQVLQYIPDAIAAFNEIYRVLAHGGILLTITPSTDGRGAFQDPRSVAYYNENSFWYVTDRRYASSVPELSCRFQVSRLVTYFPDAWHEQRNISYVCCNLIAIKDGPRQGGPLNV